jgi:hypothetical protein
MLVAHPRGRRLAQAAVPEYLFRNCRERSVKMSRSPKYFENMVVFIFASRRKSLQKFKS